jgi:hypothetical protein
VQLGRTVAQMTRHLSARSMQVGGGSGGTARHCGAAASAPRTAHSRLTLRVC